MGTGGVIGMLFGIICALIVLVEWFRRDIKPRLQTSQPPRAPEGQRGAR